MIAVSEKLGVLRDYERSFWAAAPEESVWEWAERTVILPAGESQHAGPYSTILGPYVREPLEAFRNPSVTDLTLMWASQTWKTVMIMVGLQWLMEHDPGGVLWVFPTEHLARSFSETRWLPMVRASLGGLVPDDSDKVKLLEQQIGKSVVTFVGSNSDANLVSRPKRVVIQDETEIFPGGTESTGSPSFRADQRTASFAYPKRVKTSTPKTETGVIWKEYQKGDQRRYYVPCPHCGEFIVLEFDRIEWDEEAKTKDGWDLDRVRRSAIYRCQACEGVIRDSEKTAMLREGEWRPENPDAAPGHRSYQLAGWYSPHPERTFGAVAVKFLQAKATWDLAGFDTEIKGWPTRAEGEKMDWEILAARREAFPDAVPDGVVLLTAGVDVQDDRIEAELVGWGAGEESWSLEYMVFHGDPARDYLWRQLDDWLLATRRLEVASAGIDSMGHYTQEVYRFCRDRILRRVFPVRGNPEMGRPIISRASARNRHGVRVITVGTDTAKSHIYAQMKVGEVGPGYLHFHGSHDDEYFKQLTAEECRVRYVRGFERREWHQVRRRNESLDCRVYAYAALCLLGPRALDMAVERAKAEVAKNETEEKAEAVRVTGIPRRPPPSRGRRKRGGYVRRM